MQQSPVYKKHFDQAEYDRRIAETKSRMAAAGFDLIICQDPANRALAKIAPGVLQYEVIAEVYHAQVMGADGKFGDYTSLCPLIQVGEGTSTPHLT